MEEVVVVGKSCRVEFLPFPICALCATTKPRRNCRAAMPLETARRYICLKISCRDDTPLLPFHRHRSSLCIATPFRPTVAAVALGHENRIRGTQKRSVRKGRGKREESKAKSKVGVEGGREVVGCSCSRRVEWLSHHHYSLINIQYSLSTKKCK